MQQIQKIILPGEITLYLAQTNKFKATYAAVSLHCDLGIGPTQNALVPFILRRGTRLHPTALKLNRRFEELFGTAHGVEVAKLGERQVISLSIEVPGEEYLPETGVLPQALEVLGEMLMDPALEEGGVFRDDYLDGEKSNLKARQDAILNDKVAYARMRCIQEMCPGERYAIGRYGRREDLDEISARGLYDHYREILRCNPITIFMVGNHTLEEGARLVGEKMGLDGSGRDKVIHQIPSSVIQRGKGEERQVTECQQVKQAKLCLGYRTGLGRGDGNYWGLALADGILGGFPHSKLFRKVREEASLAYYASSSLEASKGLLFIQAGINAEDCEKALNLIGEQVREVREGNFSDEEMDKVRTGILRRLRSAQDQPRSMLGIFLEGAVNGKEEGLDAWEGEVRAVTRDQVLEAAAGISLDTVYFLRGDA